MCAELTRTIQISEESWEYLEQLAVPFVDHEPDDVLRRVLRKVLENQIGRRIGRAVAAVERSRSDQRGLPPALSNKERGKQARRQYVSAKQHQGLSVEPGDGVWARLKDGPWVAIPFAAEQRDKPGRWFLGLTQREIVERDGAWVVLLCQRESGSTFDVVLPPNVVRQILGQLSISKGQYKFNLKQVGTGYVMLRPGREPLDVSDYISAWQVAP
jgi:hypothetical protein